MHTLIFLLLLFSQFNSLPLLEHELVVDYRVNTDSQRFTLSQQAYETNSLIFSSETCQITSGTGMTAIYEGRSTSESLLKLVNSTLALSHLSFCPFQLKSLQVVDYSRCSVDSCLFLISSLRTPIECENGIIKATNCTFPPSKQGQSCTLVRTSGSDSQVHFHSTFFEDHSVIDTEPFLANFDNPNLTISDCSFKNVSFGGEKTFGNTLTVANNTISGCRFDSSAEAFTGGIMRGTFHSTTLLAVNSTWTRTTSGTIRAANYESKAQVNTTGAATFRHCSWTGTSSAGPGGAIYVFMTGSLTVDDCHFTDCKGARREGEGGSGGGIFFESSKTELVSINESYFLRCHATGYAGSLGIYNSSKCSLTRTNFSHSTTDLSIPTLHFRGLPANAVLTNLRFEHARGTETGKNANSGAIDFDKILGTLYHSNILYSNNTATLGGAVYYSAVDPTSKPNVTWFSCIFYSNKATTKRASIHNGASTSCGNDIWIGTNHEEWNKTLANDATFTNCFSTSDFPRIAINLSPDLATRFPNGSELSTRLPDPALFVSTSSAGNNAQCGHSYHLPCLTLAYTITNCLAVARGEILIEAGSFNENEACQISLKDLKVTSYGNEYPILKTTTNTPFIVVTSTYALWMQWISFEVHASSVIKHQGTGTITLESCTFHGSSSPALTASTLDIGSGKVILENVIFHELVFGQGSALDCRNAQSVALSEVGFACVDSTQSSPLRLEQIQSSLSVGKIYFEDCAGSAFSDIVIDATSLSKTSGGFPSSDSTSTTPRSAEFSGSQLTEWPSYEMVVDGNDGKEDWFCWRSGQKCKTIGGLVGRLGKDFVGSVSVEIGTTAETSILVDERSISVTGKDKLTAKVELNDSPSVVKVMSQATLSFSTLTFVLMSPNPTNCLFSSLGTLTLTNVKLTHKADGTGRTGTVFSVSGGTTTLTNCGLDGEGKRMGHLASVVQTGKLVVSSSTFKNLVLEASLLVGTGDMTLLGTTFESISDGTAGSPSVRVLEPTIGSGKTVRIDSSSSFISCSSTGSGGALRIKITDGSLLIGSVSYEKCGASGDGGAMWLDVTEMNSPTQLSFSSASFGTGTTANTCTGNGPNVFVRVNATDATTTLNPTQFPSSLTTPENSGFFSSAQFELGVVELISPSAPSEVTSYLYIIFPYLAGQLDVNSVNGVDHTRCGHSSLPCKTLPIGHQNLKGTGMAVQLKENDGIATVFDSTVDWTLKSDATRRTLSVSNAASFNVKQNSLTLSSLTVQGSSLASSLFVLTGGSLVLTTCSLTSLTTTSTSSPITGTISSGHKLVISTDTSFTSCSSENGGVVNVKIVGTGMATLSGSFDGCHATSKGGAVFVDMTQISTGTVSFVGVKFGSTTANSAPVGTNLYLISAPLKTDANTAGISALKPLLPTDRLFTENEKNQFVGFETDSLKGSLLLFWFSHSSGPVHVNSLGQDHLHCGDLALACRTLEESFVRIKATRELSLDSSIDLGVGLSPLSSSLTIKSTSTTTHTLALTNSNSFKVTSGTLTFTNVILTLAAGTTAGVFEVDGGSIVMENSLQLTRLGTDILTSSLFTTKSGLMKLDGSALNLGAQVELSSQPLFAQNGGSLEIVGLTLTNVVRTIGDGSVISSTLSSGSLSIASCSFSSCVCSSGNGGVMKVVLTGTGTFTVTGTTTFSSCSASGDGNLIHLTRTDLVSFLKGSGTGPLDAIRPNTTSGVVFTSDVHEEFWGIDTNAVSPSSGSLLFYWYPHTTGSVRVASSGTDHPNCGLVELPCSSLSHSMNVMKTTKSVVMQSDMPLATSLASIDTTWTLSRSGTEKLTLSVNGGILVGQPTTHLTLSSLVMKCGTMAVDRTSALICVTNGKVSIEDCSVGDASGEIPIPFCTISTGTVELTGTNTILNPSVSSPLITVVSGSFLIDGNSTSFTTITSSLTVRSASLFALNGGSSTVNFASLPILGTGTGQNLFAVSGTSTLNLNEITLDGGDSSVESLLGQNGGTVTLEACSMSRMKMKKSFVSGSGTVLMKGCSFSSLVDDCSSGSGNVIEMGIGEGEKLEIMKTATDSCSFISCSSKGNGGALKIAVVSSGTVTISDTSFVCCSATGNGGGIWLDLSASTSTSTSFSSLVFGSGSDSNNAILGSKVFVQSSNVKTDAEGVLIGLKPTLSGSILTTAEKNEFVGNNTLPESLLFFWYPHIASSGAVHVHSDGEDHANCGRIELACQTLPHSFTSLKTTRTITLDSSLQVPASLPTLTQSLTISALAGSPQTLTLASDVSFTVSAGTLSFSSLSIELAELSTVVFVVAGGSIAMDSTCRLVNPSSATHSASLFSLSSGTLTLDTTTLDFSNRFISSQSLFSQSGGSLALSGMSIENVTQSSGDGSVISSTLSSGSLSIASCSFSSCVCSSGNGGVMKVVLTGTGTFTVTGTTTFSSCSASGDGNLIHLTRTDLVSFLKGSGTGPLDAIRPNTTSGVVFTSDVHEEFWGIDTNAVSPSSGSLLFYWYPHTTGSGSS
ncbi:hypothetical protein BLNAU_10934 [Blattamonas nauphoetae]|uniref:Uncharacterized protein n=1 Tax=Blattamonas nauphoetae TaxID=2049346 RepID=A0ABQ9XSK9_9EUKA|nr:hypothetical protein BLNAU_10934 [Blattamonas nauphoetae]